MEKFSDRFLERGIERLQADVEVPIFDEEYQNWLSKQDLAESTKKQYLSNLIRLDVFIIDDNKDFYTLFKKEFDQDHFGECDNLLAWYDSQITDEKELSQLFDSGLSTKTISDYRSAYRKYADFLRLCMQKA